MEENSIDIKRTPHTIATEIYDIKGHARSVILLSSVEIGKRLIEAKSMLSHGEWGTWLEESVDYSQSTANNLMQIYREYGDGSKIPSMIGNLSYTKAVALLGIPAEEREAFVQENDIENMSTRDLQQAIKERDQAEREKAEKEKNLKESQKAVKSLEKALEKQRQEARELEVKIKKLQEERSDSDTDEEVEQLRESLSEAGLEHEKLQKEIAELQKALRDKPIEATVIEKSDEGVTKFKIHFDILVKNFSQLLQDLNELQTDNDIYQKYKSAVDKLINQMLDRL